MEKVKKRCDKNLPKITQKVAKNIYTFTIPRSKIPIKNRELREIEDRILSNPYFGRLYPLYSLDKYISLYLSYSKAKSISITNWSMYSLLFSEVYSTYSINGYYEYKLSSDNIENIGHSVNILYITFKEYLASLNMKRIHKVKAYSVCEWLVKHLYRLHNSGCSKMCGIRYSRDDHFIRDHCRPECNISIPMVRRLVDMLVNMRLVINLNGNSYDSDYHVRSMIMTFKEIYEYLEIKEVSLVEERLNSSKTEIRYEDEDGSIKVMDETLYEDTWLDTIRYSGQVLDNHEEILRRKRVYIGDIPVLEIYLRRIWKKDIYTCGRLFDDGTIQTKPKYVRSSIVIEGEKTVSLDFKSLHPRCAYLKEGIKLADDFDPYPSIDFIKLNHKLINKFKKFYDIDKYDPVRNLTKIALLCLINAKDFNAAVGAVSRKLQKDKAKGGTIFEDSMKFVGFVDKIPVKEVLLAVIEHNKPISNWLGNDKGKYLQNIDSSIIIDCIDNLNKLDIAVLPVHDSLTCKVSEKDIVYKQMQASYEAVLLSKDNCVIEEE